MTAPNHLAPALKRLHQQLARQPAAFTQLWLDHAPLWQALGWAESQARLYLRCLPGMLVTPAAAGTEDAPLSFHLKASAAGGMLADANLADELVALLTHAGRPMPLAQLLSKMPQGRVLTEAMLRNAAQVDPRLTLAGPTVRLA